MSCKSCGNCNCGKNDDLEGSIYFSRWSDTDWDNWSDEDVDGWEMTTGVFTTQAAPDPSKIVNISYEVDNDWL